MSFDYLFLLWQAMGLVDGTTTSVIRVITTIGVIIATTATSGSAACIVLVTIRAAYVAGVVLVHIGASDTTASITLVNIWTTRSACSDTTRRNRQMTDLHLTFVIITFAGGWRCVVMLRAWWDIIIASGAFAGHSWIVVDGSAFGASCAAIITTFVWVFQSLWARVILNATFCTRRSTIIIMLLVIRTGAIGKPIEWLIQLSS